MLQFRQVPPRGNLCPGPLRTADRTRNRPRTKTRTPGIDPAAGAHTPGKRRSPVSVLRNRSRCMPSRVGSSDCGEAGYHIALFWPRSVPFEQPMKRAEIRCRRTYTCATVLDQLKHGQCWKVSLGVTVAECGNCSRSWGSQRVCEDYRTLTGRRWSTLWLDGHSLTASGEKMITDGTALRSGEISSDAPAVRLRAGG